MITILINITSLLTGIIILLLGHGLANTLLSLRSQSEGFSELLIGLIMSSYFAGFILGTIYLPGLINRIGHIRMFAISAAVGGSIVILHGIWINPWFWIACRIVYGSCLVGFYLVVESWLTAHTENVLRGRVFSIYMSLNLLALAAGQQLLLITSIDNLELFAIAAVLFSLSLVPIALTRLPQPRPIETPKVDIKYLYRKSPIGLAGCLVAGLVGSVFWTMSPLFAQQAGLPISGVADFMSITIIGGVLLQWPIGYYSDNHDRRKVLAFVCTGLVLLAIISIFTGQLSRHLMLTSMFFYGGLFFTVYPISVSITNDHTDEGNFVNLIGSLLLIYGIGATIGPLLAGLLIQLFGHYGLPLFNSVCWLGLGLFIMYQIYKSAGIDVEGQTHFAPMSRTSQVALQVQDNEPIKPE